MHSFFRIAAVASAFAAVGCASQSPRLAVAPAPMESGGSIVVDNAYVGRVNQTAQRRGIDVQWVNPPLRRTRQD